MKKFGSMFFIFMFIASIADAKISDTVKPGRTIKIGFIGPMTGDPGNYSRVMAQSILIAVDEFNSEGGAYGFKAELVVQDSGVDAKKGIEAMKKLAYDENVFAIVGASSSTVSLAVAPIAESLKIVMISPASTHKDVPDSGEYIFRNIMSDALQAVVFAKYLAQIEKVKTVAILYLNKDYSRSLALDFKEEYEKAGGKVVAMETGEYGSREFRNQLRKIKVLKPEALYLPNYPSETAVILEQAKELGFKTKIYSSDSFSNPQILELAGEFAEGVIFTQKADEPAGKSRKSFEAGYHARWGIKPEAKNLDDLKEYYDGTVYWGAKPNAYSLNSYDGAKIILNAVKGASSKGTDGVLKIDRSRLRDIVAKTKDYNGASGRITFTPNGDLVCNIGIYTVKNKKFKQLRVYKLDGGKLVKVK